MLRFLGLFLLSSSLLLHSCDEVTYPKVNSTVDPTNPVVQGNKKVLIEKFTGLGCGGCVTATKRGEELKAIYGDQMILVEVHTGPFATHNNPYWQYDFTTPAGDEYKDILSEVPGYPNSFVNRRSVGPNNLFISYSTWAQRVEEIIQEKSPFSIGLDVLKENNERKLTIKVNTTVTEALAGEHNLVVYITENGIIAPQTQPDNSTENEYVHNHVLRKAIESPWGELLFAESASPGETFENSYEITVPDKWNIDNLDIVAYVRSVDTQEILQVESIGVE
ncbi:MAG: Omp28 family outer membrane lipoprotein [Salibacteraceae bacterium]